MNVLRITSPQNPRVKAAARLRDPGERKQQQRIIIDGWREIMAAVTAGVQLAEIYCNPGRCGAQLEWLSARLNQDALLIEVPDTVLDKVAFGARNEGLVAVATRPQRPLPVLRPSPPPLVVILEELEKPGNIGAILRTAFAVAVDGLISLGPSGDLDNPNTIRASLGTVFSVPCCTATAEDLQPWVQQHHLRVCAARVDAQLNHYEFDFTQPTAIVLGSEAKGLTAQWRDANVVNVRIPMQQAADSLNVSVAAAVLLYEAVRQRGVWKPSAVHRGGEFPP